MRITLKKGQIRTFLRELWYPGGKDVNVKRYKQNVLCVALPSPGLSWLLTDWPASQCVTPALNVGGW